jgi:hypothetical protein
MRTKMYLMILDYIRVGHHAVPDVSNASNERKVYPIGTCKSRAASA